MIRRNICTPTAEGLDLDNGPFHPVFDVSTTYQPTTNSTINFLIGMNLTPPGSIVPLAWPFKGRIQEVAVYNQALSSDRIMAHIGSGLKNRMPYPRSEHRCGSFAWPSGDRW